MGTMATNSKFNRPSLDEDFLRCRVRVLINAMMRWRSPTAMLRLKLLRFLQDLGERVVQDELAFTSEEAMDEWFSAFRFLPGGYPPIRNQQDIVPPAMTISQAAANYTDTDAQEHDWQSFEQCDERPTWRRRLNFDDPAMIMTPIIPGMPAWCPHCDRPEAECPCPAHV